jgi:hypothetical protein
MKLNLINATTGEDIMRNASEKEFDRWYDAHPFWKVIHDVRPEICAKCVDYSGINVYVAND